MKLKMFAGTAVLLMVVFANPGISADSEDVRIKDFPFAVQAWTFHNFTFFETLEKVQALGIEYLQAYPGQPLSTDMPGVTFGPGLTREQIRLVRQKLMDTGISIVGFGVVSFDNNEESAREIFNFARSFGIGTIISEPAYDDFSLIEKMAKEYDIRIAIHNHPAPSKYARPETVLSHVEGLDPRIGACADTGHWMRTGVDPLEAVRMLRGRIVDVHLKDLDTFGSIEALDVPFGSGAGKIKEILTELTEQDYNGYLVIEHENPNEWDNPGPSIKKGVEYVAGISYYKGYERLLGQDNGRFTKQGWNHYGPGYFELDSATGELTSSGGMGLLWYSAKKYKDFVLELDFKSLDRRTNSGVFVRVPEMPASDSYIYHSFEIQIYDLGANNNVTGAVYDAQAPSGKSFKNTGEWNHFKITMLGNNIKIELNDIQVVDWNMEPRGKIRDLAPEGYIGLQNHDSNAKVMFRNVYVKEL